MATCIGTDSVSGNGVTIEQIADLVGHRRREPASGLTNPYM